MQSENKELSKTVKQLISSTMLSTAVMLIVLLTESAMIGKGLLPLKMGKVYIILSLVLASVMGGKIMSVSYTGRKIIGLLEFSLVFMLMLIGLGLILGKGSIGAEAVLYEMLCIVAGSITGGIASTIKPKSRKTRLR